MKKETSNTEKVKDLEDSSAEKSSAENESKEVEKESSAEKDAKKGKAKKGAGKKKSSSASKKIEVLFDNLAGKYLLPYGKGAVIKIEAKQADEMIDAGDAKEVK